MARSQALLPARKYRRQTSVLNDQGARLQGIKREGARRHLHHSARLREIQWLQEKSLSKDRYTERSSLSPTTAAPNKESLRTPLQPKDRKRSREVEDTFNRIPVETLRKRPRPPFVDATIEGTIGQEAASIVSDTQIDPVDYWRKEGSWPKEYFEKDSNMSHPLARKKSWSSLRRKRSEPSSITPTSTTPSDQRLREEKSAPYKDAHYRTLLETKGSYMDKSELDVTNASKSLCRTLLEKEQTVPKDSLFRDSLFDRACRNLQDKNEARVIQDITRLIVPSAETLATFSAKHLDILIESVNEDWNNSIPLTGTCPQPDYAVGFKRQAFTEDQLNKLQPFVGELTDNSFFMATYYMYLPFLTCEVKCGAAALDIADRQNAHSMTLAVRGIVELFRLTKREKELQREILAFSISHDHRTVRIYGHYPVIDGPKTTFYRHPIREFSFIELDGKEKWAAYKFTKNVYDVWMPTHFKRICSVIDKLPTNLDFEVSQQSELQFPEGSGLLQDLEGHYLSQSNASSASLLGEHGSQLNIADPQDNTPDISITQGTEGPAFKRPKRRRAVESGAGEQA